MEPTSTEILFQEKLQRNPNLYMVVKHSTPTTAYVDVFRMDGVHPIHVNLIVSRLFGFAYDSRRMCVKVPRGMNGVAWTLTEAIHSKYPDLGVFVQNI